MRGRLAAVRACLRIARRDAWRARGRSALVVAMIALPVMGVSAVDVLVRTSAVDPTQERLRQLGAADARLVLAGGLPVTQTPNGDNYTSSGDASTPGAAVDLRALLPPGSRLLDGATGGDTMRVRTKDGITRADFLGFSYTDPIARGLVRQLEGRAPTRAGEVAVSARLAAASGLRIGDRLEVVKPTASLTIVGTVEVPDNLGAKVAYTTPDGVPRPSGAPDSGADFADYLASVPGGLDWSDVLALNAKGVVVVSRNVLLHPPPRAAVPYYAQNGDNSSGSGTRVQVFAAFAVAAGMALLEVILLAGPAFAVGVRRARRQHALVAATGGDRRHVRDVVLGGGLVLGIVASATGLAAGIGLAHAVRPLLEERSGSRWGAFDYRPRELAFIAVVGVVTAVLAAVVPARTASRQDVVAALTGRRGQTRVPHWLPVTGALLAAAGGVLAAAGGVGRRSLVVLVGSAVAEIGLIMVTPTLIGWVARVGRLLPLAPRLALRDAVRNRGRTAPAVAAIMAAVAGSVAAGIYVASLDERDARGYSEALPVGQAAVVFAPGFAGDTTTVEATREAAARTLPSTGTHVLMGVRTMECGAPTCPRVDFTIPPQNRCPLFGDGETSRAKIARYAHDPRCVPRDHRTYGQAFATDVVVADGATLATLVGRAVPQAARVLDDGGVVAFGDQVVLHGRAGVEVSDVASDGTWRPRVTRSFPAAAVTSGFLPPVTVLSPQAAKELGLTPAPVGVLVATTRMPTEREQQRADAAVTDATDDASVLVERGYQDNYRPGLLALLGGAALLTLGAATIATGLASADGRADLATLAAVGATPRTRRVLAMAQSGVTAGLGTLLGVAAGFVPALAVLTALRRPPAGFVGVWQPDWPIVVPWLNIGVTLLVVPLLAALVAGLFTRSRLPMVGRMP